MGGSRLAESPSVGSRLAKSSSIRSCLAESPSVWGEGASVNTFFLHDRSFLSEVSLVCATDLVGSSSCFSDCLSSCLASWKGVASSTSHAAKAFAVCVGMGVV